MVSAFERGTPMPESFEAVALDVAAYQAAHVTGFGRLLGARGIDPAELRSIDDIPAVPTDAFKVARVAAFPPEMTTATFKTSGTTIGTRGVHEMRDASTYDAAAVAFGRFWLTRDMKERIPVVVIGPSPHEAPHSSLGRMCATFAKAFGEPADDAATFLVAGDVIDLSTFDERASIALARDVPMLVLATSFALVHLLDALGDMTFRLPAGSRVMHTGGFKGKSREVSKAALRSEVARAFKLPERAIVGEYGMTELSSQFYEQTLFAADAPFDVFAEPPWARVVPVDPETLERVDDGEVGLAKIVDLANVDSAVAVLTQDRVRRVEGGFELLGRAEGAPPRGCSIAIDEILGRSTA
jgi:hypothetical protein